MDRLEAAERTISNTVYKKRLDQVSYSLSGFWPETS